MNSARLDTLLDRFPSARIAVVGDYFLDKWLLIDRALDEPSVETGLTAYQVTGKRINPGAAGTVTNNLSSLQAGQLYAIGAAGQDGEGFELLSGLRAAGVDTRYLLQSDQLFTPTYIKPLFDYARMPEETHRLDIRNRARLPVDIEAKIIENLFKAADHVDAIVALDQVLERNTGVITDRVREALAELGKQRPGLILYADSRAYMPLFENCVIKCNHHEAIRGVYSDFSAEADEETVFVCALALSKSRQKPVFVTWGAKGIVIVENGKPIRVPAMEVHGPIDIVGAGDAANAALTLSLCAGATSEEAALVANIASSITIQQIGTTGVATREGIARRFREGFQDNP